MTLAGVPVLGAEEALAQHRVPPDTMAIREDGDFIYVYYLASAEPLLVHSYSPAGVSSLDSVAANAAQWWRNRKTTIRRFPP